IRVYDISGKLMSEEVITKDYTTINAMDYTAGLYFYQALSENTVIKADRFVVK
ncbi:MAG: T9SS C-terminal target domain-containing protein, partial [Flavobacterium sp.]